MNMQFWQANWDELGKDDPLWVVLTDPSKKGGKWAPAEFFATGRKEVEGVLQKLAARGIEIRPGRALDFGCGVGRLTQGLADTFQEVHGVDISPSMVEHARRFNPHGNRCVFHVNGESDLRLFPDAHFDFVMTLITLQHIEPKYSTAYLREFLRVLKPGGVAAFQILEATFLRSMIPDFAANAVRRWRSGRKPIIGMFGVNKGEVDRLVTEAGGEVLHFEAAPFEHPRWRSMFYAIRRKG